jgi:type IVB pilus formation R64 PilN family outer membrane protein
VNPRTGGPVFCRAAALGLALLVSPDAFAAGAAASRLASTRMTLRGTDLPLANVLNQIARSAQLALVVDKDVRLDRTVASPQLDDQPLDTALSVVLTPLGYSYGVDEERKFLRVFVYETRTFKVTMPTVVQDWSASIASAGSSAGGGGDPLGARIGLSARTDTTGIWEEVDKSLNRLMGGDGGGSGNQGGGQAEAKAGAPREMGAFSVNRIAGFVTVRALPAVMPAIESYFDALNEEMGREVAIEAKILQVDFNDSKAASVDWNLLAARLGQNAFVSGNVPGTNLLAAGSSPFVRVSGRAGDAFIRALEEQGKVSVMAQPTLALGNNLPAIIELSRVLGYVSQQQTTVVQNAAAQVTVQTSSLSDGLIISMLPRVLPDGEVSLALATVLQDVLEIRRENFSNSFVELPRTARRSYNGVVRARLNETLVIGGLITTRKEESTTGLPFLSRIPVLGWLFGGNRFVDKKSELIIAVTPREVKGVPAAASVPVRMESGND